MRKLQFSSENEPIGKLEISGLTTDEPLAAIGVIDVPDDAAVSLTIDGHHDLEGLKGLAPDSLTVLRLDHPDFVDDDLRHLVHLTGLKRLQLVNTGVTDAGMVHVMKLTGLVRLFLDGTVITDEAVAALKRSHLQRLSLNNTRIGDAAMWAAAQITTLTHLMCANTLVTDEGLRHLTDMTQLALLDVSESDVIGYGLADLPISIALLVICEGPKVSDEELARVRSNRPDLVLNGVRHWTPPPAALR